jgi:hypothetical protein
MAPTPGISNGQIVMADIFSGTPFSALTLTSQINNVPYTPNFLGSLGLYYVDGITTTDVAIQERNGKLEILATAERGAPPQQNDRPARNMRKVSCCHIPVEDYVTADEVTNAVSDALLTSQPQLQSLEGLIDDRMNGPFGLRARIELTHEYHRIGGLTGKVLDKDGTELYDWYDIMGVTATADHTTNFGALTADGSAFEVECTNLKRTMVTELEGLPVTGMRAVALCGDNYYDQVYGNKEVKAARRNRDTGRDNDVFNENKAYSMFTFGEITFVNYRGTSDGKVGIDTNMARLFPLGVPGLFQMLFGPPNVMGLPRKGLPVHAYMPPESQTSKRATIEAQSNPLTINLRPRAARWLKKS